MFIPKTTLTSFREITFSLISAKEANYIIEKNHYSWTSVKWVAYHIWIFYKWALRGVAQYWYWIKPAQTAKWVTGSKKDEFLELNRLWLDDCMWFNSESYVISKTLKMCKKMNPKLKWVISFADGMMWKNGTIYQSANFVYTGFRKDWGVWYTKDGNRLHSVSLWHKHKTIQRDVLEGIYWVPLYKVFWWQYRYFYFFDKKDMGKLTIPVIPFPKKENIKNDLVVKTSYGKNNHEENYINFMSLLEKNKWKSSNINLSLYEK